MCQSLSNWPDAALRGIRDVTDTLSHHKRVLIKKNRKKKKENRIKEEIIEGKKSKSESMDVRSSRVNRWRGVLNGCYPPGNTSMSLKPTFFLDQFQPNHNHVEKICGRFDINVSWR